MKLTTFIPQEILTTLGGWCQLGLFISTSLLLAVLIVSLDRGLHSNLDSSEEITRYINQVLSLIICSFAFLESVLVPAEVIHGHDYTHSFFYLTKIPREIRIGFYMVALGTVEPHVFNLFYDHTKALVEKPVTWGLSDIIGDNDSWRNIKFMYLTQGPLPSLYVKFVDSEFESMLLFARMFLFLGGLAMLIWGSIFPSSTRWNAKHWGAGNQRWYEKAYPDDPDIYWRGFHTKFVTSVNVIIGTVKCFVPVLGLIFHLNEYNQHRGDPIHDDVDSKYDYYDPFHFNHVVHNVAMLALASYLIADGAKHIVMPLLNLNPKDEIQNYRVVHLFTLFMHVWLVTTMVDANGPDSSDGEKYTMANWVFNSAHLACWLFQEFIISSSVMNERSFLSVPFRYAKKFLTMLFFTDRATAAYMNLLQTAATVTGVISLVLLVIGINGPWLHAQPIPGTITRDFTRTLNDTFTILSQVAESVVHFKDEMEKSDIYKKLSCTFDDATPVDGHMGHDYMTCTKDNTSSWLKGRWHPCDAYTNQWSSVDVSRLGFLADEIFDAKSTGDKKCFFKLPTPPSTEATCTDADSTDDTECCSEADVKEVTSNIQKKLQNTDKTFILDASACECVAPIINIVITNSADPNVNPLVFEASAEDKRGDLKTKEHYLSGAFALADDGETPMPCPVDAAAKKIKCYCGLGQKGASVIPTDAGHSGHNADMGTTECIIPSGITGEFYGEIFFLLYQHKDPDIVGSKTTSGTCSACSYCNASTAVTEPNGITKYTDCTNDNPTCECDGLEETPYDLAQDMFDYIGEKATNPAFAELQSNGLKNAYYDPSKLETLIPDGHKRWDYMFGTVDGLSQSVGRSIGHWFASAFSFGQADVDRKNNGHNAHMKSMSLDSDCIRSCNECASWDQNCDTTKGTLSEAVDVDCNEWSWADKAVLNYMGGWIFGGHHCGCKCFREKTHNEGTAQVKGPFPPTKTKYNQDAGLCRNMKRCFYDEDKYSQDHGPDKDKYNHMRFVNDPNRTDLSRKSASTGDWKRFEGITSQFHQKPPYDSTTVDPNGPKRSGADWQKNVIDSDPNYNGAVDLHDLDVFCYAPTNRDLPECIEHEGALDNFAGSQFMSHLQKQCRTQQCDFFLTMMAVALAIEVAAAAAALFPFGGGEVGDMLNIAAKALEYATSLIWRFFMFGLKIFKFALSIYRRFLYYQLMFERWEDVLLFKAFLVDLDVKIMTCFGHIIGIGCMSFFIGFWRRQHIIGSRKHDILNMFLAFVGGGFLLGLSVTVFLLFTPWAINWLLDEVLTFHHEFNFLKDAIIDIKLEEDVGYVFILLASLCATYSCMCWFVLLLKQKDQDIRRWVLSDNSIQAPYEIKESWVARFRGISKKITHARTGIGSWFQTGIWMVLIGYIIYTTLDIQKDANTNEWLIKGAVFHVDKSTNSTIVSRVHEFFKTGAISQDMGGVDEEHANLCDLIGQAIKELFIALLKGMMGLIGDGIDYVLHSFLPALRFLIKILGTDIDTIMFDAFHTMQLLVVFSPPLAVMFLWVVGFTLSVLKASPTSIVWIRHLMFMISLSGIAYGIALQQLAATFDNFKIPIFGYTIVFTTAIFKSQICCILGAFSWLQWRFDEIFPQCYTPDCGNNSDVNLPVAKPAVFMQPIQKKTTSAKLRMSSLQ